jgi:hypothetical protein
MGAYQVVGTTLNAAKKGLGLTGSERMTPELQDKIGMWIYQNQGPQAWAGWGKDGGAPAISTQNRGGAPMAPAQQRMGLLDAFGIQKRDEAAGGETALPFYQRDRFQNVMDALAMGFAGMSLDPNEGIINAAQARIQNRAEARKAAAEKNKTIEMLQSIGADPKLIELAKAGYAKEAIGLAYAKPKEKYTAMTGAQLNAQYGTKLEPDKLYNLSPTGQITQVGGGGVTISNQQESELQKEIGKGVGKQAIDMQAAGAMAQRAKGGYAVLEGLLQNAPQGGQGAFVSAASNFGLKLEGASDVEAAQAIINQLVPQQRQPGSGPMSDADLELFKRSLPRIINTADGNRLILQTLNAIADYDVQRAMIAQDLITGAIDTKEYYSRLNNLENPLALFKQQSVGAPSGMSREEAQKLLMGQ